MTQLQSMLGVITQINIEQSDRGGLLRIHFRADDFAPSTSCIELFDNSGHGIEGFEAVVRTEYADNFFVLVVHETVDLDYLVEAWWKKVRKGLLDKTCDFSDVEKKRIILELQGGSVEKTKGALAYDPVHAGMMGDHRS